MPWFRVDDSLALHPKVLAAGNRAMGLWVRAGSWCAQQLTDGLVPRPLLTTLGGTPADARALVEAGLWVVDGTGWRFHDWETYQPSRSDVESKRADARERMRSVRERRSREQSDNVPTNDSDAFAESSPNPGPARPGPQSKHLLTLVSRLAAGDGPPPAEMIDAWQDLAGPDVDLEAEAAAYLIRHGDRPARDPRGAWLGWLTKARDRADAARPAPPKPPCPEPLCADGWLTTDDPDHPRPCPQCRPHLRLAQEAS